MEGHHHHQQIHHLHHHQQHHQQQQQQQRPQQTIPPPHQHQHSVSGDASDRFPQWSVQETKEFLLIRAELDRTFMETKRNKLLWEVISTKMKERGYNRSAEQCKCKWKNLVTRYKGCETMEPEAMRQQFPFYNELQMIFTARMQRMLWAEAEGGGGGGASGSSSAKNKKPEAQVSSDDDEEDSEEGEKSSVTRKQPKKISKREAGGGGNNLREILEEFMKQQMQIELQWREAFEARESERRAKEMEWRQKMEAMENERVMMERIWREREEQRRIRDEARAEKRDALINALLNKLRREDQM